MKTTGLNIKRDKYKSSRGGYSRLFDICCRQCGNFILVYQKDGPGNLHRLYLDRILEPAELVGLQYHSLKDIDVLKCKKCQALLASAYLYPKEKRPAFRLFQNAIIKQLKK